MNKLILFALFLLPISGLQSQTCPSDPSLVLCMPLNGNTDDESGNGNHGIQHSVGFTTDRFGNANGALQLNGGNSYVEIPDATSLRPTDAVTLTCWVKWDAYIGLHPMMVTKAYGGQLADSYAIFNYMSANLLYGVTDDYTIADVTTPFRTVYEKWFHVVFTFDDASNTMRLFLNGALVATNTNQTGSMDFDAHPVLLGADIDYNTFNGNSWMQGALDDVRIYGRALTVEEVLALYNICENDIDSDGICDEEDNCDSTPNPGQEDADNDGFGDACDGCPDDPNKTEAGICGCGVADTDTDADGTADCNDGCPNDLNKTEPGACGCSVADTDTDADGIADCNDGCPDDPNKTEPGTCGCGVADTDTDADGTADCNDGCPHDPNKMEPGICGCGVADTDTDADGTADCNDGCPNDPYKTEPGTCGCGVADTDTDADGTADCNDGCPNDPYKTEPGICGCGVADTDTDADGTADCSDNCPSTPNPDQADADNDGIGDACDESGDSDCDGVSDDEDLCPGGDDSIDNNGDNIPDCSQLLAYADYSAEWKCAPNKINVCHDGTTLCISKNALAAHFNHGDKVGPCTSCPENRLAPHGKGKTAAATHGVDRNMASSNALKLDLMPNPAGDVVTLQLGALPEDQEVTLEMYNALGQLLLQKEFGVVSYLQEQINLSGLANGLYLTIVKVGDLRLEQHLVISRD